MPAVSWCRCPACRLSLPIAFAPRALPAMLPKRRWVPGMFALAGVIIGVGTPLLDAWQLAQGGDEPCGGTNPSWVFVLAAIALFVLQYAASGALEQPLLGVALPGGLPALDCFLAATAVAHWLAFDGTRQGLFMACLTAVAGPAVEITLINVVHLYACECLC